MDRSTLVERSGAPAARFNALAEPARLAILGELRAGSRCVCELRDDLGMASNLLSYHLRILRQAGLVQGARRGRRVEYRLVPSALDEVRRDVSSLSSGGAP